MRAKSLERQQAVILRRQGLSYAEIRRIVPVAKSSLSPWLRAIDLLESQRQRLREKKLAAATVGGMVGGKRVHHRRVQRITQTVEQGVSEGQLSLNAEDVRWLIGVVLHWAGDEAKTMEL